MHPGRGGWAQPKVAGRTLAHPQPVIIQLAPGILSVGNP